MRLSRTAERSWFGHQHVALTSQTMVEWKERHSFSFYDWRWSRSVYSDTASQIPEWSLPIRKKLAGIHSFWAVKQAFLAVQWLNWRDLKVFGSSVAGKIPTLWLLGFVSQMSNSRHVNLWNDPQWYTTSSQKADINERYMNGLRLPSRTLPSLCHQIGCYCGVDYASVPASNVSRWPGEAISGLIDFSVAPGSEIWLLHLHSAILAEASVLIKRGRHKRKPETLWRFQFTESGTTLASLFSAMSLRLELDARLRSFCLFRWMRLRTLGHLVLCSCHSLNNSCTCDMGIARSVCDSLLVCVKCL